MSLTPFTNVDYAVDECEYLTLLTGKVHAVVRSPKKCRGQPAMLVVPAADAEDYAGDPLFVSEFRPIQRKRRRAAA